MSSISTISSASVTNPSALGSAASAGSRHENLFAAQDEQSSSVRNISIGAHLPASDADGLSQRVLGHICQDVSSSA
jgi:hypothetical protein